MNVLTYEKQPTPDLQKTPVFKRAKIKQEKAVVPVSRHNCRGHRPAVPFGGGAVRGLLVLFQVHVTTGIPINQGKKRCFRRCRDRKEKIYG